jgi:hypothetical protein
VLSPGESPSPHFSLPSLPPLSGDSYVVLASKAGESTALVHDIYIWLGSETSQDEAGTAAILAVQLDDSLGGTPVEHREEQGNESPEFLSTFKSVGGVIYLNGGVASGFHHVEAEEYPTALLHIKGKRNVITRQVAPAAASLNQGDVFILDLGFTLYLWAGASANTVEKAKGVEVMARLHAARGGKTDRVVFADASAEQKAAFWAALAGSEADVQAATPDDAPSTGAVTAADVKLYTVSDASGTLAVTEIARGDDGRLTRDLLPAGDVALVDVGTEVFVWVSKTASDAERKNGLKYAADFLKQGGRPSSVARTTVVREGGESATFKALFFQWDPVATFDFTRKSQGIAAQRAATAVDFAALAAGGAGAQPAHDAHAHAAVTTTSVKAWIVQEGKEVSELPAAKVGEFFAGDSFVVQQEYKDAKGQAGTNFFFWLGRHSDNIERGTAALTARDLADAAAAAAKGSKAGIAQVRVVQGSEPPSFAAAFGGSLIIHSGGAKGSIGDASHAHLYHIKGSSAADTKAVEVSPSAASLNSGDSFVVILPGKAAAYLWNGKGSNDAERVTASALSARLVAAWASKSSGAVTAVEVAEGAEPEEFWAALGGKAEYPASVPLPAAQIGRLFEVSDASGSLQVSEVFNWSQEDLVEDDVIVLDAGTQVFVWIGSAASPGERSRALEVAGKYVEAAAAAGRLDANVPIVRVESGAEPASFTSQFAGWDSEKAAVLADPYSAKVAQLSAQRAAESDKVAAHAAALEAKRAAAIAAAEAKAAAAPAGGDHTSATLAAAASGLKHTGKPLVEEAAAAPAAAAPAAAAPSGPASGVTVTYNGASHPIEALKAASPSAPGPFEGANLAEKQTLVAEKDYPTVFGMSAADFNKLPGWKQKDVKKKAGLF